MAKIMIIDDDVELSGNLSVLLQSAGHTVTTFGNVDGAVDKLRDGKPDLLILDVMFPENPVAGFDLARKIRHVRALEALPIIMLTGVNQYFPMDFSKGDIDPDWMPVQDFIEKPVESKKLLRKIAKLLDTNKKK